MTLDIILSLLRLAFWSNKVIVVKKEDDSISYKCDSFVGSSYRELYDYLETWKIDKRFFDRDMIDGKIEYFKKFHNEFKFDECYMITVRWYGVTECYKFHSVTYLYSHSIEHMNPIL
jgi:hypothetical protein